VTIEGFGVLSIFERDFEGHLATLRRDAEEAAKYGFAELAVHVLASRNPEIRDRVQEHAGFWNTVLGGFQGSSFIALGRLFDRTKGTVSAAKVLTYAIEHPGIFTKQALKARRQKASPDFDEATYPDFFKSIHPANKDSFAAKSELDEWTSFFSASVEGIRHQVFAHSLGMSREKVDEMFSRLPVRKYETLLVFPLRLLSSLDQLYMNGRKPDLPEMPTLIHEVIEKARDRTGRNAAEHITAVREVATFLDWMTQAPSAEADARNAREAGSNWLGT
jgi:hypothetical protein